MARIAPEGLEARDLILEILVIKLDSAFVYGGVTDWMNRLWKENAWKKSGKKAVKHVAIWQQMDLLIETLEKVAQRSCSG